MCKKWGKQASNLNLVKPLGHTDIYMHMNSSKTRTTNQQAQLKKTIYLISLQLKRIRSHIIKLYKTNASEIQNEIQTKFKQNQNDQASESL